jgi:hypothetical protein
MTPRRRWIIVAAATGVLSAGIGGGVAVAATAGDHDTPISGPARTKAEAAALAYTGGGQVTGTEVNDEESFYEVEVTLSEGRQVDVQLDNDFHVVGSSADVHPDDPGGR